ncbi:unnamed protein product [Auanema sp. JU1783]|nr:unnamed protein product [Auanema sp. JU1783]
MKRVEDYIADTPMEIGKGFLPKSEICLPSARLPLLPSFETYPFSVEVRAREMYQNRNEVHPKPVVKETSKPSSYLISTEVLQPTVITESVSTPLLPLAIKQNLLSFDDFEAKANVFDELEWSSIDDRAALSQVLGVSSEPTTPACQTFSADPTSSKGLPSYPSLSFKSNDDKKNDNKINGLKPKIDPQISSTTSLPAVIGTKPSSTEHLYRERLLKKGYREQFVNVALQNLPRLRWVHIEYYIKAMSTLHKQGIQPLVSMQFLNDCELIDKQAVLDVSQEVVQCIASGTNADEALRLSLEKAKSKA